MKISGDQMELIGWTAFLERLKRALLRDAKGFSSLSSDSQDDFLVDCLFRAQATGLITERGIASYALAAWWLDIGFEQQSRNLMALLHSAYPEVRKVYAMNEWAQAMIGDPGDAAMADQQLIQGFHRTQAWGGTKQAARASAT